MPSARWHAQIQGASAACSHDYGLEGSAASALAGGLAMPHLLTKPSHQPCCVTSMGKQDVLVLARMTPCLQAGTALQ